VLWQLEMAGNPGGILRVANNLQYLERWDDVLALTILYATSQDISIDKLTDIDSYRFNTRESLALFRLSFTELFRQLINSISNDTSRNNDIYTSNLNLIIFIIKQYHYSLYMLSEIVDIIKCIDTKNTLLIKDLLIIVQSINSN
jgi:hypothetical protein